jgi:capsule polysaccharide export protein KpsE/RkpR
MLTDTAEKMDFVEKELEGTKEKLVKAERNLRFYQMLNEEVDSKMNRLRENSLMSREDNQC